MMNILVETKDIAQTQAIGFAVKGVDRVADGEEETIRHGNYAVDLSYGGKTIPQVNLIDDSIK